MFTDLAGGALGRFLFHSASVHVRLFVYTGVHAVKGNSMSAAPHPTMRDHGAFVYLITCENCSEQVWKRKGARFCSGRCSALARPPRPESAVRGAAHPCWQGDHPSYAALHTRVRKLRGKADRCLIWKCSTGCTVYEWANISGQYKDVGDFMPLCLKHHAQWDEATYARGQRHGSAKLTETSVREMHVLRAEGWSQRALADRYGVSRGTVSTVLAGKTWSWLMGNSLPAISNWITDWSERVVVQR